MNRKDPAQELLARTIVKLNQTAIGINVSDSKLGSAIASMGEALDSYQKKINSVSADIRALEGFLQKKDVAVPFTKGLWKLNPDPKFNGVELQWAKQQNHFRLLCSVTPLDDDGLDAGPTRVLPLIDMPLQTRLAIFPLLPEFLNQFSRFLKAGPETIEAPEPEGAFDFTQDEIPF